MQEEISVAQLIAEFGFPVVMVVGLGYFVYYVWQTINNIIDPAVLEMKTTIIRLTDQLRLLDQDMIRLQQKVNTAIEINKDKTSVQAKCEKCGKLIPLSDIAKHKCK